MAFDNGLTASFGPPAGRIWVSSPSPDGQRADRPLHSRME